MAKDDKRYERTPPWKIYLEVSAFVVLIVYTTFAGLQYREMHRSLVVDQRAWVSVVVPSAFPLDGSSIPASIQIVNSGKTPAKDFVGKVEKSCPANLWTATLEAVLTFSCSVHSRRRRSRTR
jgi:hypothetical protein